MSKKIGPSSGRNYGKLRGISGDKKGIACGRVYRWKRFYQGESIRGPNLKGENRREQKRVYGAPRVRNATKPNGDDEFKKAGGTANG